jgi:uncharacterized membrane protein YbhN (UPF0104 family)
LNIDRYRPAVKVPAIRSPTMTRPERQRHLAVILSALIAGGTVVAIAASERPRALLRVLGASRPLWLLAALGCELAAYIGYILAYRATVGEPRQRDRLSLAMAARVVIAGFGPFVPLGGFAFDRRVLRSVHRSRREARRQVLALGVVEYLLLAPAACVCALILLLGDDRASPALTLPWVFGVPPGFALAWWATQPRILARAERSRSALGRWLADLLAAAQIMRQVVTQPLERPWALIGMAVYWAAEIACLAFALNCFSVEISAPAIVVAYATGYAATRRALPFGGAGVIEALLTVSLIAVHVNASHALLSVVAYRLVNFLAPTLPGLLAHSSLSETLDRSGERGAR